MTIEVSLLISGVSVAFAIFFGICSKQRNDKKDTQEETERRAENDTNEIRPVLKHLGIIAEKHNCAIILIGHMNKASGSKSTYRGLGSIDIQATARSVLLVARLRDKPNIRIMAHDKSSLAPAGDAIGFEMTEDNGMVCIGPYDITILLLMVHRQREQLVQLKQ